MANVTLDTVRKTYPNGYKAVHGADFQIRDGEFIVLVGPSGCGKSTLLRMIAGLEDVTDGEILIDNAVVNDVDPARRDIAMVFQNYALYPHMSVRQNMAYGLKNQRMNKAEIASRIEEAARTLRLEDYLERKPGQLSGGQRQRVAMGRAIVRHPKVFLFDEPLSNLDAKLRTQLRAELKALHKRLGATFVYVTHDQVEAMSLADRIIIMSAGQVEQIGTPMDLYLRPASRFVADFIGSPAMNIVHGALGEDQASVTLADGTALPLPIALETAPGTKVDVGVRPEHLHAADATSAQFNLTVDFVEQLGADTVIHGYQKGVENPLALRLTGIHAPEAGTVLTLGSDAEHLHIFESATGRRLN
ncbi:sn-glycerol-3-phosphate ABC transporter ATP-binding protein UgpC [Epibacterium sp. SM1979]|uniref:sn-glycerol-3-phosphate ABC transporter ATP-binding protein UgpC n=1 Tax=Tritonibacter litoralis TaxID=2662264 RepID=A0A843YH46_9RHOB|nr:sn-glycerol-3-phosphate import ATP-binding protein UgpC [Tritonibacter litoralis]MQQ08612.1 sn-glycerol-3-phosphate ABC transporter ATP-binding protein UgpC [Tritonibacter litoralis]